jgi:hypothetical protein
LIRDAIRAMDARRWISLSLLTLACSPAEPVTVVEADASPARDVPRADAGFDMDARLTADVPPLDVPRADLVSKDLPVALADLGPVRSCARSEDCDGGLCVMGVCARDLGPCASNNDCGDDSRCDATLRRCVPHLPGGRDETCTRDVRPGVFAPAVQCRFNEAPAGDPYPEHLHVLSTPMVADLRVYRASPDDPARPSIIAVFDDGSDGGAELPTGVIRILDGRTCAQQAVLSTQLTSHSSPVAVGDLDGDGTLEIVAFKAGGGLVAFRWERAEPAADAGLSGDAGDAAVDAGPPPPAGRWVVMWRSSRDGMPFDPTGGGWAGPTLADLDNDGRPEVLRHGMVFSGQTGAYLGGESARMQLQSYSQGAFSVVQDVDEDNIPELVTGNGIFLWAPTTRAWVMAPWFTRENCTGPGCGEGHVAVANFGDYATPRFPDPGTPEIAVVSAGYMRIDTLQGRTVFGPVQLPGGGTGGPPTIADFDGDGFAEVAAAGARAYSVFDPDCGVPSASRVGARCPTMTTNGVLWSRESQDMSSNVTGSTSFDFEGDGRVEAVYADECFARVYDGRNGTVLFSQHHSSCTWYENPVVADVDGDFRAEIVVGSNFNCGSATTGINCPGVGPRGVDVQFAGVRCFNSTDCLSGVCNEGFCRCAMDSECCPPGGSECTYVCALPPEGTPGMGNTCRASRPVGVRGLRVYSDVADRWVGSRPIWNQHAYNVTNVGDDGRVPRASMVPRNWRTRGLNNFRTNVQGTAETLRVADATLSGARAVCEGTGASTLIARLCNRGTAPLPDAIPVGFYQGDPANGGTRVCRAESRRALEPGDCIEVPCVWNTPPQREPVDLWVLADDGRTRMECHEGNNLGRLPNVVCQPPG